MCPAGDNKWDAEAMYETFLYTNICPQDHQCPLKNSGDVCKLLKYRVLERKIDGDDLN